MNLPDAEIATKLAEGSASFVTDKETFDKLMLEMQTSIIQKPSRPQRRAMSRGLASGLLKQAHGASLKRKTRRQIARASARRNRR